MIGGCLASGGLGEEPRRIARCGGACGNGYLARLECGFSETGTLMSDWTSRTLSTVLTVLALLASSDAEAHGVGLARLEFRSKSVEVPINAYVFYPTDEPPGSTRIGVYELAARPDVPARRGTAPLIIISHGQGGSPLGHHDMATFLASRGHVVASLEHPKDNVRDSSGVGTPDVLLGRPAQVSALIDALAADRHWASRIDFERIGVAGFSMGGYTALVLAGARPDFTHLLGFCREGVEPAMCDLLARHGALLDANNPAEAYVAALQIAAGSRGRLSDPRIKAAFVMAPMALVFNESSLRELNRPVYLHYAAADRMLEPARNAASLAASARALAGYTAIVGADHWVYLAPCSLALAEAVPEICVDPPGVDRAEVHRQILREALAFFADHLDP